MAKTNRVVGFSVSQALEPEFSQWEARAKSAGQTTRDWLFARVREALAPPPVRPTTEAGNREAVNLFAAGLMAGRLERAVDQGAGFDPMLWRTWRAEHPREAAVLEVWVSQQPWAPRSPLGDLRAPRESARTAPARP